MAFEALGSVCGLFQWHRVNRGSGVRNQQHEREESQDLNAMKTAAVTGEVPADPDAMGEKSHTASARGICTIVAVSPRNGCTLHGTRN